MATNSPASIVRVHVLHGDERAGRRGEDLGQSGELERNVHRVSSAGLTSACRGCRRSMARAGERSSSHRRGQRRDDVGADERGLLVVRQLRQAARPRQLHRDRRAKRGGRSWNHRDDAIGEEDRFFHAVGDHHGRHRLFAFAHRRPSSCCSVSRVSASSAPNGSSRNSTCGFVANARAMATRWRMPPESCLGRRSSALPSPTCSSARVACASLFVASSSRGTSPRRPAARSRAR